MVRLFEAQMSQAKTLTAPELSYATDCIAKRLYAAHRLFFHELWYMDLHCEKST